MRRLTTLAAALALLTALGLPALVGCAERAVPASEEAITEAAPAAADGEWGTIKGRIVWAGGEIPTPNHLNVNKDQGHCLSKGPILSEDWVINPKNKGVRWVVVWLVPNGGAGKLPIHPSLKEPAKKEVEIDQPCCKFEPHALAIRKGQALVARNSSPIAHNVDWKGIKQDGGNTLVPPGQKLSIKNLKATGFPVSVSCGIHPWMKGWVWVFDHPYYAVTDADGNFEIKDVPAGKCNIVCWQETRGYRTNNFKKGDPIEVKAGGVTDLGQLEIAPKNEKD
jgi:hypothetical protein